MKVDAVLIDLFWFLNQNQDGKSWSFQSSQITQPAKPLTSGSLVSSFMVSTALQVLLQAALESDNRCGQTVETCGTSKTVSDVVDRFSTSLCFLKTRLQESVHAQLVIQVGLRPFTAFRI